MMETKPIVLFVDDDPMLLASTKRRLMSLAKDWEMHFCDSGMLALELFDRLEPAVVVTDMRMPCMDGVGLLKEVLQRFPLTVRIILSGQTEMDRLQQAHVVAHEIMRKPCEAEQVRTVVSHCLAIRQRIVQLQVQRELLERAWLPLSPNNISDTLMLLYDSNTRTDALTAAMRSDPEVSACMMQRMTQIVPRVSGHPVGGVMTPESAIATVGGFAAKAIFCMMRIARRVVAKVVHPLYLEVVDSGIELGMQVLHAACHDGKSVRFGEECLIAALFQELGKLAMYACHGEKYIDARIESVDRDSKLAEVETAMFQVNHAELGAYLLMHWSFSPHVIESVLVHDDAQWRSQSSLTSVAGHVRDVATGEHPKMRGPSA
ncbi:MAG: HDOD domain-containing protein [Pirellula sp.]